MIDDNFYHFGKKLYRFRYAVIILWVLLSVFCLVALTQLGNPFKETGFKDPNSESSKTDTYINQKLGYNSSPFIVLYTSKEWLATDSRFQQEITDSLRKLKNFPIKNQIIYPTQSNKQISTDKKSAYAAILFNNNKTIDDEFLKDFKHALVKPPHLTMQLSGEQIFLEDTKKQTEIDLFKAEYIATPVAIITLLIVFGSIVAASLPIILGGFFALLILTILFTLGQFISLSVFTLNIAFLLGLCISIDYALFIVSRFRQEISRTDSIMEAVANTQATAGKAVFFSGLAVLISLSALLFFPINIMFSVGIGGITSVALAVITSTILLPAVLGILGKRVNAFTVPFCKFKQYNFWHSIATTVINHRWSFFIGILALLFVLASPMLKVQFGISDITILPKALESRAVFDVFKKEFGEGKLSPITVMIETEHGDILSRENLERINDITRKIKNDSRVAEVSSITSADKHLSISQYDVLYHQPEKMRPEAINKLLKTTTTHKITVIDVVSKSGSNSPNTLNLIKKIRTLNPGKGLMIKVTGSSANTYDALISISHIFLYALLWILFFTYIILLILLRSLFLPLKAILMNLLSVCASYGVLTFVFQEGHFHTLLGFDPQGILDVNLLIIIFCALFGFSMDYEVFLLSRIKEEYEETGDNIKSTIYGIVNSSRIITSAAIIVIFVCFSFMSAEILIVKAFGLGIACAIFVDAFIIRTILVPATMAILGKWNWYLPKWLDTLLPKISFTTHSHKNQE